MINILKINLIIILYLNYNLLFAVCCFLFVICCLLFAVCCLLFLF